MSSAISPELRALQLLLQAHAVEAGLEASQLLLQRIVSEGPSPPVLHHTSSMMSSTSEVRRNWADFSDDEEDQEG